ncbi:MULTISPECIES: dihydrofolate reductase [unclassified Sporolactobacillus]|uniref:dihydrofolate reductase n=1 Tax=unclassified Sporolactobacillus TaxID=2628533 RepID=UPI002367D2AF|nr:dihydrofolate reductase [Sporolactobacillus sp. CQH2019]MDD9148820.1 dihydrofolate reductase [Sporolactobacillus sp. CQH2019]
MISFLVAMDRNRLIGRGNDLPWHLPADLRYFKKITTGHPVIMGRKTFESIGKPLPGRKNIVLTRDSEFRYENVAVFHSAEDFLKSGISFGKECFVIGGAQIFETFIAYADRLYITCIDAEFEGDTYFTAFDEEKWRPVSEIQGTLDRKNVFPHTFFVYERA